VHLQDNETGDQPAVAWDKGHKPPPMMEVLPAGSDVWVQVRVVQTREDQIMVKYPGVFAVWPWHALGSDASPDRARAVSRSITCG